MAHKSFILETLKQETKKMAITNPVVKKVFEDLEAYRDFCRFEGAQVFDEKALYNRRDKHWQAYETFLSGNKKKYFKPKKAYKTQ